MSKKGFTLIEILIAMMVFSIVITLLFSSFRAFIVSSEQVKETLERSDKIAQVFKRIRLDMESIYIVQPPQYIPPSFDSEPDPHRLEGNQENIGQRVVSSLVFSSLAHAALNRHSRPGVARISYYLKENERTGFDLYRSDFLPPYPEESRSCIDALLCTDISGFDIVFYDEDGEEHLTWDSESEEFDYTYPEGIGFKLTTGFGDKERKSDIRVELLSGRDHVK